MLKRHPVLIAAATLALLSFSISSVAQQTSSATFPKIRKSSEAETQRPHLGIMAGMMNPDSNYSTAFEYGLDVGFQPVVPIGVGLEISHVSTDRFQNERSQDLSRTTLMPKISYNLGGTVPVIRYSYLALGAGAVIDSRSPNQGTHFGWAPIVGFDIPLVEASPDYITLGVAAKYLFVSGAAPDGASLNGLAKYWF